MEQTTLINACNQPTPLDILFRKQPVWSTQENTYFIPKSLTIIYLMINKKLMSKIGFHKHCFLKSQIQQGGYRKCPHSKAFFRGLVQVFFFVFFCTQEHKWQQRVQRVLVNVNLFFYNSYFWSLNYYWDEMFIGLHCNFL